MTKKDKIEIARELRKKQTKTEELMWHELRDRRFLGLKFRRQHLIEGYIVDFYCAELRLVIEIDGLIHLQQTEEDKQRQKDIEALKIKFIRFKSKDVENNIERVLQHFEQKVKS